MFWKKQRQVYDIASLQRIPTTKQAFNLHKQKHEIVRVAIDKTVENQISERSEMT